MSAFDINKVYVIDTTKNLSGVIQKLMELNFRKKFEIFSTLERLYEVVPYFKNSKSEYNPLIIVFIYVDDKTNLENDSWPVLSSINQNNNLLYVYLNQHVASEVFPEQCVRTSNSPDNCIFSKNYISKLHLLDMINGVGNFIDTYITMHEKGPFSIDVGNHINEMIYDIHKSLDIKSVYDTISREINKKN